MFLCGGGAQSALENPQLPRTIVFFCVFLCIIVCFFVFLCVYVCIFAWTLVGGAQSALEDPQLPRTMDFFPLISQSNTTNAIAVNASFTSASLKEIYKTVEVTAFNIIDIVLKLVSQM